MRLTKKMTKWLALGILGVAGIAAGVVLGVNVSRGSKPQQRVRVPHFRTLDRDMFRTSVAKVPGGGEPASMEGAAQEAYDNRAYPAASIAAAQQLAAATAADAIRKRPGGKKTNWQELGPSGVPASALVASESTGASAGARPTATQATARSSSGQRAAASGKLTTALHRSRTGIPPGAAFRRMPSARSSSIPMTRAGRHSMWGPVSRTDRATPRPASVCSSRRTSESRGRWWRGAPHRPRRARPAWERAPWQPGSRLAPSRSIRPIAITSSWEPRSPGTARLQ